GDRLVPNARNLDAACRSNDAGPSGPEGVESRLKQGMRPVLILEQGRRLGVDPGCRQPGDGVYFGRQPEDIHGQRYWVDGEVKQSTTAKRKTVDTVLRVIGKQLSVVCDHRPHFADATVGD